MTRQRSELTDAQWAKIAPLIPEPKPNPNGGPWPIANRRPSKQAPGWLLRGANWWAVM